MRRRADTTECVVALIYCGKCYTLGLKMLPDAFKQTLLENVCGSFKGGRLRSHPLLHVYIMVDLCILDSHMYHSKS